MSHKTEDGLFLLGGALLGAAAMYMLDPEQGERRRQRAARAAQGALNNTTHHLTEGWEHVRDQAGELAGRLNEHAHDYVNRGADMGSDVANRAKRIVSDLSDRASALHDKAASFASDSYKRGADWADDASNSAHGVVNSASRYANNWRKWGSNVMDQARGSANRARSRARHMLGEEEGFGAGSVAGTAVACCAAGVAAMYLLDPNRGHSRRAKVVNSASSCVRETGRLMRATGRHLSDRLRGITHRVTGGNATNSDVARRVRALLSQYAAHPDFVNFTADADGTVTVMGPIDRVEAESLLEALNTVPGVTHIINRLEVREHLTDREVENYSHQRPAASM